MREAGHAWPASPADSLSPSTGPSLSRLTSQDPLSNPHCRWWGDSPSALESLGGVAAGLLGASEVLSLNLTDCVSSISQELLLGKRTLTASAVALRVQLMSWSVEAGAGGYSRHEQETDWSWSLREGPSWSSFPLRKPENLADAGHTVNGWVDRTLDGHQSTCPPVHPSVRAPSKYRRARAMCWASLSCWEDRRYLDTPPTWSFISWKQLCLFSRPSAWCRQLCSGLRPPVRLLLPAAVSSAVSWAGYPSLDFGFLSACEMGDPPWGCWARGRGACALRGALGAARRCRAPLPSRARCLFCALTNGLPTP